MSSNYKYKNIYEYVPLHRPIGFLYVRGYVMVQYVFFMFVL